MQKPEYVWCIGDWSSDVCSSGLGARDARILCCRTRRGGALRGQGPTNRNRDAGGKAQFEGNGRPFRNNAGRSAMATAKGREAINASRLSGFPFRSEEHTSELQSLMRISYAVFCLKKKQKYTNEYKNK